MPTHLHTVHGYFYTVERELSSCSSYRDHMGTKPKISTVWPFTENICQLLTWKVIEYVVRTVLILFISTYFFIFFHRGRSLWPLGSFLEQGAFLARVMQGVHIYSPPSVPGGPQSSADLVGFLCPAHQLLPWLNQVQASKLALLLSCLSQPLHFPPTAQVPNHSYWVQRWALTKLK